MDADRRAVFSLLTDIGSLAGRIGGILDMTLLTDPPVGLGTRFVHSRRFGVFVVEREVEITAWDPPRRFVASFRVLGVRVDSLHLLERERERTRFSLTVRADPRGAFRPLALLAWQALSSYALDAVEREVADIVRCSAKPAGPQLPPDMRAGSPAPATIRQRRAGLNLPGRLASTRGWHAQRKTPHGSSGGVSNS